MKLMNFFQVGSLVGGQSFIKVRCSNHRLDVNRNTVNKKFMAGKILFNSLLHKKRPEYIGHGQYYKRNAYVIYRVDTSHIQVPLHAFQ